MTTEWVAAITALASAIAAVLAWAAKLWWGKEYSRAKDEVLKAKDAQIAAIERELAATKELTPMKIREYFKSMKEQLEEYNEKLKADLKEKDDHITRLIGEGKTTGEELARLRKEITDTKSAMDLYIAKSKLFNRLSMQLEQSMPLWTDLTVPRIDIIKGDNRK